MKLFKFIEMFIILFLSCVSMCRADADNYHYIDDNYDESHELAETTTSTTTTTTTTTTTKSRIKQTRSTTTTIGIMKSSLNKTNSIIQFNSDKCIPINEKSTLHIFMFVVIATICMLYLSIFISMIFVLFHRLVSLYNIDPY